MEQRSGKQRAESQRCAVPAGQTCRLSALRTWPSAGRSANYLPNCRGDRLGSRGVGDHERSGQPPMSSEKTEAVVIRLADFSESSRVVTLFSRDWGKISAIAKGAKRLKGPFEAALDLLTACRIVFLRKSSTSLDILTEAQVIKRFRPQAGSLVSLYGGYYVAELLTSLTEEYDPHVALYQETISTLGRLADEADPRLAILRFEVAMLREIGQMPQLDECAACGRSLESSKDLAFWVSQGGLICKECQHEQYRQNRIQAGSLAILRQLASDSPAAADRLAASPEQLADLRQFATAAISHALGRRPKMLRYLK